MTNKHVENKEIILLNEGLAGISDLGGVQFSYGTAKTSEFIKRSIKALEAAKKNPKEYDAFMKAKYELQKKYAVLDDKGKETSAPFEQEWNFFEIDIKKREEYLAEADKLAKKYAKIIAEQVTRQRELTSLLNQTDDIQLHTISADILPEGISLGQAWDIILMIDSIETPKLPTKKRVLFNNKALIDYRSTFEKVWQLRGKDFVKAMLPNMEIIYKLAHELAANKAVLDFEIGFEKQRIALADSMSEHDDFGMIKFKRRSTGQSFTADYAVKDITAFNDALNELRKKNKKVIDTYEEFLMTEVEIELFAVPNATLESCYNLNEAGERSEIKAGQTKNLIDFID